MVASIGDIAAKVNPAESQLTQAGMMWPPTREDAARVEKYKDFRAIFEGGLDAASVLSRHSNNETASPYQYISANLAKVINTIQASIMFGEDITLKYEDGASDKKKKRVDDIWERNHMQSLLGENQLDTGHQGDGVFTESAELAGKETLATIKSFPAEHWAPELNPDDIRDVIRHRLGWIKKHTPAGTSKEQTFLRLIIHDKGTVTHELWLLKSDGKTLDHKASDAEWLYFYDAKPVEVQPGVEGEFLVQHVPNYRTANKYFGFSVYAGVESMLADLDARLTQTSGILDYHSNPILAVPPAQWAHVTKNGTQDPDRSDIHVTALDENGAAPQYVTWDGKLGDNFTHIDKIMRLIGITTDTAAQFFGLENWGSDLSGRALKILLLPTLAKVAWARRYYDAVVPKMLELAQRLEGEKEPVKVTLDWPDGLPADVMAEIEAQVTMKEGGLQSQKRALKKIHSIDDKAAEDLQVEIDEEDVSTEQAVVDTAGRRTPPPIQVTADLGGLDQ